jgi:hypothetical protein
MLFLFEWASFSHCARMIYPQSSFTLFVVMCTCVECLYFHFTRGLDGIPPLVELLHSDYPEVQKNACGALKNLSYGRGPTGTDNKVPTFSAVEDACCNDYVKTFTPMELM